MIPREVCPRGHDNVSPYTRRANGECRQCGRDRAIAVDRRAGHLDRKLFCRNGHLRTVENTAKDGRCKDCAKASRQRTKKHRPPDPLGRTARNERNRIRLEAQRRAAGIPARNWSEESLKKRTRPAPWKVRREVDAGLFVEWFERWYARHPDESLEDLSRAAGSSRRLLYALKTGERSTVRLDVVDRFLVAAGEPPSVLDELYPLDHEYAVAA